jgi:hypothetical protein
VEVEVEVEGREEVVVAVQHQDLGQVMVPGLGVVRDMVVVVVVVVVVEEEEEEVKVVAVVAAAVEKGMVLAMGLVAARAMVPVVG